MNWTRRHFLMSAGAPLLAQSGNASSRPNIVFVLADDLAAWMTGCYGNLEIKTPNIDRIATGGVRFINNFVCSPICSASRATLFTGRTPRQHGIQDFLTEKPAQNPDQGQAAPPPSFANEIMISDLLAQNGYSCGYVGKWHMGNDERPGHGFTYTATVGARTYQDPTLSINGSSVQEKGYLAEILTKRACDFLDQQTKNRPFFLTVGYLNPHTPYDGHPQKYYDMYKSSKFETFGISQAAPNALREKEYLSDPIENIRKCAASTTALDDQIPVLLRKLISRGLFENTIFIFTGDNGYLLGRHGLWSKGHASDPINMYDEVVQTPLLMSWPGMIPVSSARPEMVSFYDFFPTLCEATGVNPPSDRNLCGRSYLSLAANRPQPKGKPWPGTVYGNFRYTDMARDNRFKLVVRHEGEGPNELFDIRQDPRERVNRYADPGYVTVRDGLNQGLSAWRQKYA